MINAVSISASRGEWQERQRKERKWEETQQNQQQQAPQTLLDALTHNDIYNIYYDTRLYKPYEAQFHFSFGQRSSFVIDWEILLCKNQHNPEKKRVAADKAAV